MALLSNWVPIVLVSVAVASSSITNVMNQTERCVEKDMNKDVCIYLFIHIYTRLFTVMSFSLLCLSLYHMYLSEFRSIASFKRVPGQAEAIFASNMEKPYGQFEEGGALHWEIIGMWSNVVQMIQHGAIFGQDEV